MLTINVFFIHTWFEGLHIVMLFFKTETTLSYFWGLFAAYSIVCVFLTSTVARAVTLERILTYQTYVVKHDEKRREYDANYLRRIISNRTIGIVAAENVQRKW